MSNIAMSAWDLAEEDYLEPPESPEYDPPRWTTGSDTVYKADVRDYIRTLPASCFFDFLDDMKPGDGIEQFTEWYFDGWKKEGDWE